MNLLVRGVVVRRDSGIFHLIADALDRLAKRLGFEAAPDGDRLPAVKLDHEPARLAERHVGNAIAIDVDLFPNPASGSPPNVTITINNFGLTNADVLNLYY